jgi:hypothetical protein
MVKLADELICNLIVTGAADAMDKIVSSAITDTGRDTRRKSGICPA